MVNYMKSWDDIYEIWANARVPEVEIIKFDLARHKNHYPWFSKDRNSQAFQESNPIRETGRHLVVNIHGKNPEYIAAFKIMAYARSIDKWNRSRIGTYPDRVRVCRWFRGVRI